MEEAIALAYEVRGNGPAVLFVHGHPFDRTLWADQLADLESCYHVIAPDLRGYGESPMEAEITTLGDHARDLEALLQQLAIDRVVICGLSMGGQIAMEFCLRYPERVAGAVFVATFATPDDAEGQLRRYRMAERLLQEGMAGYAQEVLPRMMTPQNLVALPEAADRVRRMMERTSPRGAAASLRGRAKRTDYSPSLMELRMPTLVIVGSEDAFTTLADAEHMQDMLPMGRLAVIEGAGHLPNIERREQFCALLEAYLGQIYTPDSMAVVRG